HFVESLKQSHLHSGILFGLGQCPAMRSRPVADRILWKEYAYCKSGLPVGSNVKNELGRWRDRVARQSSPLPDKIVLIHVSLAAGIGFHATQGHVIIGRWSLAMLRCHGRLNGCCSRARSRVRIHWLAPGGRTCDKSPAKSSRSLLPRRVRGEDTSSWRK